MGRAAARADVGQLSVDGRTSAHPSVASAGRFVAVAWAGTRPEDNAGNAASGNAAKPPAARSAGGRTDVFVAVSRSGGDRFGPPVQVNKIAGEGRISGEMPPLVRLHPRPDGDPEVIVVWTARTAATSIKIARSRDGGRTFGEPQEVQTAGARGDRGWAALAVDKRGTAHTMWLDHRALAGGGHAHGAAAAPQPAASTGQSAAYLATVDPRGTAEHPLAQGVCYCCKTALVTGPRNEIYAAWRHVYANDIRDIAFAASRDGGRTFTAPVRISEDGWQINGCPDDGPAMAVDRAGTIHIVWPTVVATGSTLEGALFYASSRDGRTFTKRLRVPTMGSVKPSHPQIALDETGGRESIVLAWDEVVSGRRRAFVRRLDRGADGNPKFGATEEISGEPGGAYPAIAVTPGGAIAVWTAGSADGSAIGVKMLATAPSAASILPTTPRAGL